MRVLLQIAATEVLEHRRQPWMLFILALNYLLWISIFGVLFVSLAFISEQQDRMLHFQTQLQHFGVNLDAFLELSSSFFASLSFTNLPLYVAIMSGTSVLHEKQCGTLPFLMLAPITRRQLLLAKIMGAMAIPVLLHLSLVGVSSLAFGQLRLLAPYAHKFAAAPAWWVAFLLGVPASAAMVGALGTVISALARDMRSSMQYVSFFIGLLSLGIGYILVDAISRGVMLQLAFAGLCCVIALAVIHFGALLISKDIAAI